MTLKTLIEQVFERVPDVIENEMEDWGAVEQIVNEALQRMYAIAIVMYPEFYIKSTALSNVSSFSLPSDFYQVATVVAPAANRGGVRLLNHRDTETVKRNTVTTPTTSKPIAVIEQTTIEFTPAVTGTLYYLWTFGFQGDDTVEVTDPGNGHFALLPSIFEEETVLMAVDLLRARYQLTDDIPSQSEQALSTLTDAMARFEAEREPKDVYGKSVTFGG